MARNIKLLVIFLVCGLIIIVSGCGDKLSEGKAKGLIIDKYFEKNAIQKTVIVDDHGWKSPKAEGPGQDPLKSEYEELEKKGMLKVNYETIQLNDDTWMYNEKCTYSDYYIGNIRRISLTDKGVKHLLKGGENKYMWKNYGEYEPRNLTASQKDGQTYEMVGAVKKFVKITGITDPSDAMGVKMCAVQYETKWEFTPFGEALLDVKSFPQSEPQSAIFVHYQDGWRLQ